MALEMYNGAIPTKYKNAEISIIVEDDEITTAMVFMDGECVYRTDDINLPFNGKNNSEIKRMCRAIVDKELAEDGRTECTDMALVQR